MLLLWHKSVGTSFLSTMTLERLTQRIQEENDRVGKVDGRRFNIRSRKKMGWEMRKIEKSIATSQRKKRQASNRSTYTKEELQEYKNIEDRFRADMQLSRALSTGKQGEAFKDEKVPDTPVGTPERSCSRLRPCSSLSPTPGSPVATPPPVASSKSEPKTRRQAGT